MNASVSHDSIAGFDRSFQKKLITNSFACHFWHPVAVQKMD
jgi:hypothetical protein